MSFSKRKVYCVFGCSELGAYMHRFPHPTRKAELFKTWLSIVGEQLKDLQPDKIYRNKRICDYHFKPEHKVSNHRLLHLAVPSLHLNGMFSSEVTAVQLEHNYSLPRMWSTETRPNENVDVSHNQQSLDRELQVRLDPDINMQPSTSKGHRRYSNEYLLKHYKTSQKENRKKWLCYPSYQIASVFNEIQEITTAFIKSNLKKNNIRGQIQMFVDSFIVFPHTCDIHIDIFKDYFCKMTINILLYSWCRSLNRILSGKLTSIENDDPLKQNAQAHYNKYKHNK